MSHNIKTMYDSLRTEYTKAEDELKTVDNSLKKLIGTDTYNETSSISRSKDSADRRRTGGRGYLEDSKRYQSRTGEMGRKRRLSESNSSRIFSRLDRRLDDDISRSVKRPSLQSTIVSTNQPAANPIKVKQENIVQQDKGPDKKSAVRNRRMFGMIMGTLQKFQSEETQRKVVTIKKEEIEKKLDKADAEEREAVKKERQSLIRTRKDKQTHLKEIEMRMERVEIHQQWEKSNQHLANFIQTKTKPHIFYLPNKLTPETEKRLKETRDKYLIILAERRAKTQKEIEDLNKKDDELRKENLSSVIKSERHEPASSLKNGLKSEIKVAGNRSDGRSDTRNETRSEARDETRKEARNDNKRQRTSEEKTKDTADKKRDTKRGESEESDEEDRMSDKSDSKHSEEPNSNGALQENKAAQAEEERSQKQADDESSSGEAANRSLTGDESNQTNEISHQTNDESTTNPEEVSRSEANTEEIAEDNTADNIESNIEGLTEDNTQDNTQDITQDNMDDNSQPNPMAVEKALEDKEFEPIYDE